MENKGPKVIKMRQVNPPERAVRSKPDFQAQLAREQLRRMVLRNSGLPDDVNPYMLDGNGAVTCGGNSTAVVRHFSFVAWRWALEQCHTTKHGQTPENVYYSYPCFYTDPTLEQAVPIIGRVLADEITAEAGAVELESVTRNAQPALRNFPPSAEPDADPNHAIELSKALAKAKAGKLLVCREVMAITGLGRTQAYETPELIRVGKGRSVRFQPGPVLDLFNFNKDGIK